MFGGLAHQVAGEEHRVDRRLELRVGLARVGRAGDEDGELLERQFFCSGLSLVLYLSNR